MNKVYKAIIVGGGASGLFCAIELLSDQKFSGEEILILEKNDRVGKKLIATGNGQGNLTNSNISEQNYHGDRAFIADAIKAQKQINLIQYLRKLGIPLLEDENGRMYPLSRQASAVLDIIRANLSKNGCQIKTGECVVDVKKQGEYFILSTKLKTYKAKSVVLATGGSAGPSFGTDGTSYHLAENFGHKKTKMYPSLVQLKTELSFIRGLKGIKERAKIYAYDGDKSLRSEIGDLLFTEYGISGDTVFRLSTVLVNAKNPKVKIEFLPEFSKEDLLSFIQNLKNTSQLYNENPLIGLVNKRVGLMVYKRANSSEPKVLADLLKNYTLNVIGNLGFSYAQVTKGGIATDAINPNTYESKLCKGLYLLGEMIDVDGDCGGYNLTFAFKSAILSAQDIKAQNN